MNLYKHRSYQSEIGSGINDELWPVLDLSEMIGRDEKGITHELVPVLDGQVGQGEKTGEKELMPMIIQHYGDQNSKHCVKCNITKYTCIFVTILVHT